MIWGATVGEVTSWITSLGITGAVAAAAAWAMFKWLGGKWIEDHFSRELEAFKSEKAAELEKLKTDYGRETERLKADLNRFADRASRFHAREYEVLPEAWGLMNKAFGAASSSISAFQQHPDLNRMAPAHFSAWLEQASLEQYQKDELNSSTDKNKSYIKMINWKKISEAESAIIEFINYVILQGVFIDEDLSRKMMEAGRKMRVALISRSMGERLEGQPYVAGQTNFWQQAADEIAPVEDMVLEVKQDIRQHLTNIRLVASTENANLSPSE